MEERTGLMDSSQAAVPSRPGLLAGWRAMLFPIGALVVLNLLDALISRLLINKTWAIEGNPFLQNLVGDGWFVALKVAGVLLCGLILLDVYRRYPRLALFAARAAMVIYTIIVCWNAGIYYFAARA